MVELRKAIIVVEVLKSRDVNDWEHQIQFANNIMQESLDWMTNANISKSQISKIGPLMLSNQIKLQVSECVNIIFKCNEGKGYHYAYPSHILKCVHTA